MSDKIEKQKPKSKPVTPMTVRDDGVVEVKSKEGMSLFGSKDEAFINGLVHDVLTIVKTDEEGQLDREQVEYFGSMIEGINPRDQVEAMLATQMAATHKAIMRATRMFSGSSTLQQVDSAERAMNKLARTFTTQMDALKKYRCERPELKVRDVNVADGGQAIVGNVNSRRSENEKS